MTTEAAISAGPIGRAEESRQSAAGIFLPWIACVALMAVTGLFIHFVGAGLETDPRKDMFGVTGIAVFGLLGGLGVFLASRTGFPAAWDARIGNRVRFVYPLALGAGLGVVSVVLELLTGGIAFVLDDLDRDVFNAPLPGSVLLYSAGAVVLEVVYRLLPIPVVMWVAQRFGFPERHRLKLFWVLAVLTSSWSHRARRPSPSTPVGTTWPSRSSLWASATTSHRRTGSCGPASLPRSASDGGITPSGTSSTAA
jgi:hypothetical protein